MACPHLREIPCPKKLLAGPAAENREQEHNTTQHNTTQEPFTFPPCIGWESFVFQPWPRHGEARDEEGPQAHHEEGEE